MVDRIYSLASPSVELSYGISSQTGTRPTAMCTMCIRACYNCFNADLTTM